MKVNGKWYPKSVLVGSAITTEQVAKRLAAESTVSPADVRAVLTAPRWRDGRLYGTRSLGEIRWHRLVLFHGINQ